MHRGSLLVCLALFLLSLSINSNVAGSIPDKQVTNQSTPSNETKQELPTTTAATILPTVHGSTIHSNTEPILNVSSHETSSVASPTAGDPISNTDVEHHTNTGDAEHYDEEVDEEDEDLVDHEDL